MNSDNVVKNLRALWRTDRIIAELRMRHMLVGLSLRAFAALIAAFGLLMFELAAYFALVQVWSAISAAAILGVVNFLIAMVLFVIAGRPPAGRELELANEIHGSAVEALQTEARGHAATIRRHGSSSSQQRAAADAGAADHDHRQRFEEIQALPPPPPLPPHPNRADHRGGMYLASPHQEQNPTCPKSQRQPILNASLPAQFRQIRIALAREPGHPDGDAEIAYILVAPLDVEDRIDPKLWKAHRDACRVVRQRPDEQDGSVSSFTVKAVAGSSTMTAKPLRRMKSAITSPTNVSSLANMYRSGNTTRCTPTA